MAVPTVVVVPLAALLAYYSIEQKKRCWAMVVE
jgi:hypothetical protein